ncbi:MAG: Do family serine endopeptidase [Rhodospirillales bacterium]
MKSILRMGLASIVVVAAMGAASAQAPQLPHSAEQVKLSFAPLVKAVSPAVVNIYARRRVQENVGLFNNPFARRFFGEDFLRAIPKDRVQNSLGSGVIVRSAGLVVTNNHVVQGADQIRVVLADRREYDAKLLLSDARSDLAVLSIVAEGEKFPYLELRNSDDIEVGDLVVAIGNPFGLSQTVTFGIVSANARTSLPINETGLFIQTDAAINPGNSGGALVGMDGRLVGINTAILSQSGGSIGIGFATPANIVARVVESAESGNRRVIRPWLGASVQPVTPEIAGSLGLPRPTGVMVRTLTAGGPAETAGLRSSDVIAAINGQPVDDERSVRFRLATLPLKGTAPIRVLRGGKAIDLDLPLQPPPENPPRDPFTFNTRPFAGATFINLSPAVADEFNLDTAIKGVMVSDIATNSMAVNFLRPRDIVQAINDLPIHSVADLRKLAESGVRQWRIQLRREGQIVTLALRI